MSGKMAWLFCIAIPIVFSLPAQVAIQPRPRPDAARTQTKPTIRVDTNLVLVPVTVNDPFRRPVVDLEKDNFHIFDNGQEQSVAYFGTEDDPIALGLVLDTSGSMGDDLQPARAAAEAFFEDSNPEDEFCLVEFNSTARLEIPLTRNVGDIYDRLLFSRAGGSTALIDAIYIALNEIRKSKKPKKALVIISDGGDNHSRYTPAELKRFLSETDVLIYSILAFGTGAGSEIDGPDFMTRIAEATGGRALAGAGSFAERAHKIGLDLRNRYLLGYVPHNEAHDGRYHRIQVKLSPPRGLPQLQAHWRQGYYDPDY
jgi:Ca-activated chloride channel homolog